MMEVGKGNLEARDQLHGQQLLRDMDIINARTREEFGALPLNGAPVIPKRKPNLPGRLPAQTNPVLRQDAAVDMVPPSSVPIREAPHSSEGEPMSFLDTLLGRNIETEAITYANCAYHLEHPPAMSEAEVRAYSDRVLENALVNEPNFDKYVEKHGMPKLWPLRFNHFIFGGYAFNVKECRIIYGKSFYREWKELQSPPMPKWLDEAILSWSNDYLPFPKLDLQWTSLDGDRHKVILDLEKMLRKREVVTRCASMKFRTTG